MNRRERVGVAALVVLVLAVFPAYVVSDGWLVGLVEYVAVVGASALVGVTVYLLVGPWLDRGDHDG